jgi:fibro-slime domain-containing protein
MVDKYLGEDQKPVLVDAKGKLTSEDTFNQWFRPSDNNIVIPIQLTTRWDEKQKAYTFWAPEFFPVDGLGWSQPGLPGGEPMDIHNFGFCMEFHNQFTYKQGQIFDFTGDDDVWVFINNELVIDLGGPHPPMTGNCNLDTLGLTEGETYPFAFFYCERHKYGSSLKFTTSIELHPCGLIDADEDGVFDLCDYCPMGNPEIDVSASKSSGLSVPITISLGNTVRDGLSLNVDFGDGTLTTVYTAIDTNVVHTYEKPGTYTVTVTSDAIAGCISGESSVDVTLTTESSRIAPKCSAIPTLFNTPMRR